jgi:hypothetical protein
MMSLNENVKNIKYSGYTTDNVTAKKEQEITMTLLHGDVVASLKKRIVG